MTKDLDNCFVKLPNNIYDSLTLTNEEFTVLLLLYRNYMLYKNISLCNIQMLIDYLKINSSTNREITKTITGIIISLMESKNKYITNIYDMHYKKCNSDGVLFTVDEIIKNKNTMFYVELPKPPEKEYFIINDNEIDIILDKIKGLNINKYNLIRYFCACRRVTSSTSQFGYLTQGKLKEIINDSRTIKRYNEILQDELHLIRYNNSFLTPDKHYCTTFIGFYDNEVNFNFQLQIKVDEQKLIPSNKVVSNKKRSLKQQLNNVDDGKDAKIKELEDKLAALQYKEGEPITPTEIKPVDDDGISDYYNEPKVVLFEKKPKKEKDQDRKNKLCFSCKTVSAISGSIYCENCKEIINTYPVSDDYMEEDNPF